MATTSNISMEVQTKLKKLLLNNPNILDCIFDVSELEENHCVYIQGHYYPFKTTRKITIGMVEGGLLLYNREENPFYTEDFLDEEYFIYLARKVTANINKIYNDEFLIYHHKIMEDIITEILMNEDDVKELCNSYFNHKKIDAFASILTIMKGNGISTEDQIKVFQVKNDNKAFISLKSGEQIFYLIPHSEVNDWYLNPLEESRNNTYTFINKYRNNYSKKMGGEKTIELINKEKTKTETKKKAKVIAKKICYILEIENVNSQIYHGNSFEKECEIKK
jgi:hypothetical protein